jgi:inhibitor of KinA sporulation pathway (predicted exonuclease)
VSPEDCYVVLDFEATCDEMQMNPQEMEKFSASKGCIEPKVSSSLEHQGIQKKRGFRDFNDQISWRKLRRW